MTFARAPDDIRAYTSHARMSTRPRSTGAAGTAVLFMANAPQMTIHAPFAAPTQAGPPTGATDAQTPTGPRSVRP